MIPLQPVVIGKTESRRSAKVTPFFVHAESKSFCRTRSSRIFAKIKPFSSHPVVPKTKRDCA